MPNPHEERLSSSAKTQIKVQIKPSQQLQPLRNISELPSSSLLTSNKFFKEQASNDKEEQSCSSAETDQLLQMQDVYF